jgi:hypothetical protein
MMNWVWMMNLKIWTFSTTMASMKKKRIFNKANGHGQAPICIFSFF